MVYTISWYDRSNDLHFVETWDEDFDGDLDLHVEDMRRLGYVLDGYDLVEVDGVAMTDEFELV